MITKGVMNQGLKVSPSDFIKQFDPAQLLFSVLAYAMGAGVADFLGEAISWENYWIGLSCIIFFIIFSNFLKGYFDFFDPKEYPRGYADLIKRDHSGTIIRHTSAAFLITALSALSAGVGMIVLAKARGILGYDAVILIGLVLFLTLFYAAPPLRLVYSGYGELSQAILITNIVPALALLFQTNHLHRLLGMVSFPVTFLFLAMRIGLSLKDYGGDITHDRSTLLSRMGWRRGMFIHNLLALSAYLITGTALLLGLPWGLAWPFLLTLPLALFQVGQINLIQAGSAPKWAMIKASSYALAGLGLYMVTFSLWVG